MAVFYVLPPRSLLAQHFVCYLREVFPGLEWEMPTRIQLTETLESVAKTSRSDVFIVYREEIADEESTVRSLQDGFGAEEGDEVVEILSGGTAGELVAHRWSVQKAAA